MGNTHPEVRIDKNGKSVVRHIRDHEQLGSNPESIPSLQTVADNDTDWWGTTRVRSFDMDLSPATKRMVGILKDSGLSPVIVGGSVRDALMGMESKDIDIEVFGGDSDDVSEALRDNGIESGIFGKEFGVVKAVIDGEDFDLSIPRRDSKNGVGYTGFSVEFDPEMTFQEASSRRDFTINAIGFDPVDKMLLDPHDGENDIRSGVLRHVSDAFDEDPLRVMRGVQFAGRFGFDMAPETISKCRAISHTFPELPKERIWVEWDKLSTKSTLPSKALEVLHQVDWEKHFPKLAAIRGVPQDMKWHPEGPVHVHQALSADAAVAIANRDGLSPSERQVVVLAAMLHDLGKATHTQFREDGSITSHGHAESGAVAVEEFLDGIGAPGSLKEQIVPIVREHMCTAASQGPTESSVRRLQRRLAGEKEQGPTLQQWARVVEADQGGRGAGSRESNAKPWVELAESMGNVTPKKSILTGRHLISAGMKPGPEFRAILEAAISAQDDGLFDTEEGAVQWLNAGDFT